ncbi:e3 ubiquitin-protein ligase UBR4 [Caerostris darwini]|uniref:E3 ubiquitin-protein ligase UBR4 n=1 Tax=Caerostris darwini TaxID=1538125 RepID=A0AAV4SSU4_9ARAC|nr:e3 ubiquitin-protein ligase UBR4 [Caerostris darwini]
MATAEKDPDYAFREPSILLLRSSQSAVNKYDVLQVIRSVIRRQQAFLDHEDKYENFFASYAALSAHYITTNIFHISKSQVGIAAQACKVLLQYFLQKLQNFSERCCISQKQIVSIIYGLCNNSKTQVLSRTEVPLLTLALKLAKEPPAFAIRSNEFQDGHDITKEPKRPRLDPSANILEQLMTPMLDTQGAQKQDGPLEVVDKDGDTTIIHIPDPGQECKALLLAKNKLTLQILKGVDVLLDTCLSLPSISPFTSKLQDSLDGKGLILPATTAEAVRVSGTYKTLSSDIQIISEALSLPVLEPLSEERIRKVMKITLSCLYASITVATANSILGLSSSPQLKGTNAKDDENENCSVSIVETSLEIYNTIAGVLNNSTRAGGHVLQNLHMIGSWIILGGLHYILNLNPSQLGERNKESSSRGKVTPDQTTPSKGKDSTPAAKPIILKIQQGYGVLSVALATHAVSLVSNLLDDLRAEVGMNLIDTIGSSSSSLEQFIVSDIIEKLSGCQRVQKLASSMNLTNLLFSLASVSYRKACMLKRIQKNPVDGDNFSTSDSNTYYEDDFSSSEDSSDETDDDSEPILGQWFEETLAPPEPVAAFSVTATTTSESESNNAKSQQPPQQAPENCSLIPDKGEPNGYISLASKIFSFMNNFLVNFDTNCIKTFLRYNLGESQMIVLAGIIKDLDRETSRTDSASICVYFGPILGQLYEEFSQSLAKFIHNILATNMLSDNLQNVLLAQLGVSPKNEETWPLQVYSRTLSVLAQTLLLRQQREKDELRSDSETSCVMIWLRLLNTLKRAILTPSAFTSVDEGEDINVEHAQLLLFLFHNLHLMQKKGVLLTMAQTIMEVSSAVMSPLRDFQILYISRMLLIFEYMMRNLYDAPPSLIEQIQKNLFSFQILSTSTEKDNTKKQAKMFFPCKDIEENYVKNLPPEESQGAVAKPRFFNLMSVDFSNQEVPKLDGFALSFILSSGDILKYPSFYYSIQNLIYLASQCDMLDRTTSENLSFLGLCAVQYSMNIAWRLMLCLPPSVQSLESIATGTSALNDAECLHAIVWSSRANHKIFSGWMKDTLVKQGLTTQKAESLLRSVTKSACSVKFDIKVAKQLISKLLQQTPSSPSEQCTKEQSPRLFDIFLIECAVAKVQVALDEYFSKPLSEGANTEAKELAEEMLPIILQSIEILSSCIRWSLLHQFAEMSTNAAQSTPPPNAKTLQAYNTVLRMASSGCSKVSSFTSAIADYLPPLLRSVLGQWNSYTITTTAWRNDFANDIIPSESYIISIQNAHMNCLSGQTRFTTNPNLKRLLHTLVRFAGDLIIWCPENNSSKEMIRVMLPLLLDATTESLGDYTTLALERLIGSPEGDDYLSFNYFEVLTQSYNLLINHSSKESDVDEHILHECLKFMEGLLDKSAGKKAMETFFTDDSDNDMVNILLSAANSNLSPVYGTRVLKFFSKLFQQKEKNPTDKTLEKLCSYLCKMSKLGKVDSLTLQQWLGKVIFGGHTQQAEEGNSVQENRLLLQSLTSYIVKQNSSVAEKVAHTFLSAMIPMGSQILSPASEGIGFSELMVVMAILSGAGSGTGHYQLFQATPAWLELCKKYLAQKDVLEKLESNVSGGKHQIMMESCCYLLSYMAEIVGALRLQSDKLAGINRTGTASPPCDGDLHHPEIDSDWAEDMGPDEEESAGEDSDEDSLCNKLCTFTITQKEFMNQHWYHCHTCKMIDGAGVCTICAKVCHKDHDVTYAKFGSFFCDCGAKEDGNCQALVKRNPKITSETNAPAPSTSGFTFGTDSILPSSLRRRPSSPTAASSSATNGEQSRNQEGKKTSDESLKHKQNLSKQLELSREILLNFLSSTNIPSTVLELMQYLMPAISQSCQRNSPIGSSIRAQNALLELHSQDKVFEQSEQLMVPTLGSQEGAFENVRMNYSGEQGQTIRQLISSHMIRRVAMCCLASPQGKRQHLAVSHEKGKITLLQLSALLKQADSSKRKLTLTRLASAPVPFVVLSITGNPYNEDFLAVCGLKDCHILTFSGSGSVSDHLVLHPQLESGNYIIKAIWLPGSQTELALVTADMVKIYDLSQDALSPQFFFLLPSEKIRDCCFIFSDDGQRHLVLMSSAGHIYYQPMVEESSAKHGPFYVTNILETKHTELKDSNGMIGGGGVSIYYSHTLQLLFFSYTQGKSFIAPLSRISPQLSQMFLIQMKNNSNNGNNSGNSKPSPQPLCQWSEVANHPGLILAQMQASNNPVILMVKPDAVLVQEIKFLTAKSKITDMVAIRHVITCGELRTTLILLCEDGSLRIYMANQDQTNYWLTPAFQPATSTTASKPSKKKKAAKSGRPVGSVSFPIDFFEHCTGMNDIEFGGNDVLQVYNTQQIKHRLNTTGLYIASTKPAGFTIEVNNSDNSMVMVGCRILVGNQDVQRAPSYIEIFGRSIQVNLTRSRWYDFPFSREESLTANKKLNIFFGASSDPSGVTMVDSVKIFGKTKEAFGWPDDSDDFPTQTAAGAIGGPGTEAGVEVDGIPAAPLPLTPLDRLVSSSLELLDGCFSFGLNSDDKSSLKSSAIELATSMLTLPMPSVVHEHVKNLLATLHNNRSTYCSHKDDALLSYVLQCLNASQEGKPADELDGEALYRLIAITRGVAVARPSNLLRFAESHESMTITDSMITDSSDPSKLTHSIEDPHSSNQLEKQGSGSLDSPQKIDFSGSAHFIVQLTDAFWHLHSMQPSNPAIAPVSFRGLVHVEATVHALVEVIHAFTACDLEHVALATKLYVKLLLCEDTVVSFSAKQALIRVLRPRVRRRKVFIPSPPRCSTPGESHETESDTRSHPQPQVAAQPQPSSSNQAQAQVSPQPDIHDFQQELEQFEIVDGLDPLVLLPGAGGGVPNLEALIAGQGGFPMLDIPPDDDETMVELAIALSLQDQPEDQAGGLSLQALSLASQGSHHASSIEGGHYSDTTASAGASDDEGSTAATDGSTLRTSPAEQGGSAGSESGGSGVESIMGEHNVSGRSSAYGDNVPESITTGARSETSSVGLPSSTMPQGEEGLEIDTDVDTSYRLHTLRLMLLEKMLLYFPQLNEVGGVRAIPFMQVILMLTSDLVGEEEKDCAALAKLLPALITALDMNSKDISKIAERTPAREVNLIVMRLLSIMMSRVKGSLKTSGETSTFCSSATALALVSANAIDYCLQVLKVLLDYWKGVQTEDKSSSITGNLLKSHPLHPPPDMSPFFLKQYVKGHANDVFEAYPQLVTEMVLRLPYQIKKIINSLPQSQPVIFSQSWFLYLCEYMMMQQTPFVRRQVRKLLLFICGSKDKYRQLRDFHALESHMKDVKAICNQGGFEDFSQNNTMLSLSYDSLINMIEHLKACSDIATSRTINWQKFCQKDESILSFLIHVSFLLDEGVSPIILQLLQCALCGAKAMQQQQLPGNTNAQPANSPSKQRKEKVETEEDANESSKGDIAQCVALALQVNKFVEKTLLSHFIRAFLLESNSTSVRWQAHSLIFHLHKNSSSVQQEVLLDMMWKLWPKLPAFGRRAAQFVDLLGYFTLNMPQQDKEKEYIEKGLEVLHQQNQLLMNHPNSNIYNSLQGLVEFDGYFLESEPCLVCNNPEVPYTNIKLSAIKVDSRFTTTTQIVKLIGSHTISKITLRIGDLKRNKMVHTLNIYYNNRSVQSVVELKNRPSIWNKAKKCTLAAGQTELKIEFPLPIVACNLMIEYADFYENIQASSETLQCPRCSASVPANPGVCANCGENVFQCHKCRAINYDEKDPFLCNSCGFCKYAKFDYTITAKPCCAVDPIENEEDRKKAISTINSLLEKADRVYKQLIANKPALEILLLRIYEHGLLEKSVDESTGSSTTASVSTTNVNRAIQQLAQRYCTDCKASFDELSKIVQKVLASRKELVDYERRQRESRAKSITASQIAQESLLLKRQTPDDPRNPNFAVNVPGKCYGCASSAVEHCITLLRALSTNTRYRLILCSQGLIRELVAYNLRHGNVRVRHDVRQLLCSLTRDNARATTDLNALLMEKIATALKGHVTSPDLAAAVRHEVALLASSLQKEDSCWEQRLRCVMKLFLMGVNAKSSVVMESITLPCLRILQVLIKPEPFMSKKNKDKSIDSLATVNVAGGMQVGVDLKGWLTGDSKQTYKVWKQQMPTKVLDQNIPNVSKMKKEEVRNLYLIEKYSTRWREKTRHHVIQLKLLQSNWLRRVMFNPSSQAARNMACNVVEALCQIPSRRREVLDMLTAYLDDLGSAGESAAEFLTLYQNLISPVPWKHYLALRGLLPHIGNLITSEIEHLSFLEETTLNSDLSQGYALKMLTELLESFIEVSTIRQHYKSRLVGCVLNGYLCLRKLVVQRTKLIDETQEKLLELLEEMTTGTESETMSFMAVCVETVKKYGLDDLRTPVFIFERLCSVIYPEESDSSEFYITLEKDPQQEDFLQGRMLGNPYSSNEPGMGPLMRDVKNKICQDCELVALLEDDSGMELLVNNKIINLDLPVKDVYKKVWCTENNESEAMRIVYRMRGLLGDATEEFIENLDTKDNEEVDTEEVYKIANVMSTCGGLEVMLERMATITDLSRGRSLLTVLLKLFGFCIKVKSNRQKLVDPEMGAIRVMLSVLRIALSADSPELLQAPAGGPTIIEQLLQIMETILAEAASKNKADYAEFCKSCGEKEDITFLLSSVNSVPMKNFSNLLPLLMRIVPFLTFSFQEKMESLIDHFKPYLNFNEFDYEHTSDDDLQLECFCMLTAGIECNFNGNQLKDLLVEKHVVQDALEYITAHAPPIKSALLWASDEWREFTSKPALKYVLKLLTGLSQNHETTQHLVSAECIPIIHRLEQVSSDERVGSLAENLMEAIKKNPSVAQKIEEVRKQTKDEKKRLAMAMREKQLGALGMSTNEKGQVTAKSSLLKNVEELGEESGLVCIICREGYKFQPTKVLGIYTFTKRCNAEDFENRARKTPGYSTVTHFNVVHVDCHMAAVRHARGRDEWESAALQNANTKCNGLLPLWGPQVPESAFASCLARHNTYLQECTGHRDVGYASTVHDIKLLLQKFAFEKSFSEDSGGGGPQSNMHLIPYLIHMTLYVINTTRFVNSEEKNLINFLEMQKSKWVENCYELEGPLYWMTMAVIIIPTSKWQKLRVNFLIRTLILAQCRHVSPQGTTNLSDTAVKDFTVYKFYLLFFGLIDGLYKKMFKKVAVTENEEWAVVLADYVRQNDQALLEASDNLLRFFEDDLMPVQSFAEFCDVLDLLHDIPDPQSFLEDVLDMVDAHDH